MNGLSDNSVERLREISNYLDSDPLSFIKKVHFPGWNDEVENDQELLVKEAASAILATGVLRDEGTQVSRRAIAALLHYIADMME